MARGAINLSHVIQLTGREQWRLLLCEIGQQVEAIWDRGRAIGDAIAGWDALRP